MPRQDLESRLAEITREFVTRLVHEIRNASFAEVAALPDDGNHSAGAAHVAAARAPSSSKSRDRAGAGANPNGRRTRRSAEGRAEVGERVLAALDRAGKPMGVRDIAETTGLSPDALAAPLKDLRTSGRVRKHGDKRATKYSAA
ncbi:MAG: hypothetical protein ACRENE_21370 [Polyangiaceae bacterium]